MGSNLYLLRLSYFLPSPSYFFSWQGREPSCSLIVSTLYVSLPLRCQAYIALMLTL